MTIREYPAQPLLGVGAVVRDAHGRVVLVRRRQPPLAGQWSLPGGLVEVGETMADGVAREILEETGLTIEVGPIVEVLDRIIRDDEGRVRYHYVLVDFVCEPRGGVLIAASDAADAVWADAAALDTYGLAPKTRQVIAAAMSRPFPGDNNQGD